MANSDREREARQQIAETEEAEARDRATGAASLFDLRMVIGGLLAVYGAILTVMGLFASAGTKAKAAGININLWAGLVMLLAAAAFIAWAVLRPLKAEEVADDAEDGRAADRR
ncbi:MAG TPA: hypothetical protein VNK73_03330 [Actinomycetota bacterium]|jgi:hypothetical protein|nr:hypothetical protein [Actinomycetota bacterium]